MTLKKGQSPAELPYVLTITGQGSTDKLSLVYHNRKPSEVKARLEEKGSVAAYVPWIVKEWDTDFALTEEGVTEFEDEYPGIVRAVLDGWHLARHKEAEKN
jgi:hypothetical protein